MYSGICQNNLLLIKYPLFNYNHFQKCLETSKVTYKQIFGISFSATCSLVIIEEKWVGNTFTINTLIQHHNSYLYPIQFQREQCVYVDGPQSHQRGRWHNQHQECCAGTNGRDLFGRVLSIQTVLVVSQSKGQIRKSHRFHGITWFLRLEVQ